MNTPTGLRIGIAVEYEINNDSITEILTAFGT
jgi:hypothetical protein